MHPVSAGSGDAVVSKAPGDGQAGGGDEPRSFDPTAEYDELLKLVDGDPDGASAAAGRRARTGRPGRGRKKRRDVVDVGDKGDVDDVYQKLMAKERRVLDAVNRVVNDRIVTSAKSSGLFGMPIHELVMRTFGSVLSLFEELVACRSLKQASEALGDDARRPFLGVALVASALALALLSLA